MNKLNDLEQKKLYKKAKEISFEEREQSITIINQLDLKYFNGFISYINANEKNEESINKTILLHSTFLNNRNIDTLVEIAFSIVHEYPYKALNIYKCIEESYDKDRYLPAVILDLFVEIVDKIADVDKNKAIKLLEIMEIDSFREEARERIKAKS